MDLVCIYGATAIDRNTGEVVSQQNWLVDPQAEAERKQKKERSSELKKIYGNFYNSYYNLSETYFPNLSEASLARLLYSLCFLDYKGYLTAPNSRTHLNEKRLKAIMRLSPSTFHNWFTEMIDNHIFILDDSGLIKVNNKLFFRGRFKYEKDEYIMKNSIECTKYLYESVNAKQHVALGYLYKMIPYVNIKYNILCHNPFETDIDNIEPITLSQLCTILGVQKQNINKLIATLHSYQINGVCAVSYITDDFIKSKSKIFINPKIYYAGDVDFLAELFKGTICNNNS